MNGLAWRNRSLLQPKLTEALTGCRHCYKPGTSRVCRVLCQHRDQESTTQKRNNTAYLSDLVAFQSEREGKQQGVEDKTSTSRSEEVIERATHALERARLALEEQQERAPSRPSTSVFNFTSKRQDVKGSFGTGNDARNGDGSMTQEAKRASLADVLLAMDDEPPTLLTRRASQLPAEPAESTSRQDSAGTPGAAHSWQPGQSDPQLLKAQEPQARRQPKLQLAEPSNASLDMISQDAQDAEAAKSAILPPFQSVMELTTAAAPPQRGEAPADASTASSSAGRALEDGEGRLADGTRFKRESGEVKGERGYWYRWTKLSGISPAGQVEWEERWWEASDWAGMKELGAEKSGCRADGSAWRETWREAIGYDDSSGEPMVERTAHKWAKDASGDEWEEKWGEHYWSKGRAHKWADKWGKDGASVWHERWGEDYKGGESCFKFTDKWAEKRLEGGALEQWGDKWEEDFGGGKGTKKGETWSVDVVGQRYQRWWGEHHIGNGWVQKYGNSSTGEQWDVTEQMDTYYNPIPHFGYRHALDHSPTLKAVPTLPRAGEDLGDGIGSL